MHMAIDPAPRATEDSLRQALAQRLGSHPPGLLEGGARIGAALHSETLDVLDLHVHAPHKPWQAHLAQAGDPPAAPFGPQGNAPWRPHRFGRTQALALSAPLTLETLPGHPLIHRSGGVYTGIALADMAGQLLAIYASDTGLWWARPWTLFADGRFTPAPPRLVAWRDPLEARDA